MTMNAMDLYFNIVGFAAGVYCLYTWFKLKKEGKLFTNQLLVPKDAKPEDCVDEEGYIRIMSPCLFFAGLIWGLIGAVGLANGQFRFLNEAGAYWLGLGGSIVCVLAFVVYLIVWLRARKRYWVL